MATFGIAMVRDEADIIASTVERMLAQVDDVIVADNGSIDGTREILEQLPVTIIDDSERGYYQSRKMTHLAAIAAEGGADWVVPFDADEVWYSPTGMRIADHLAEVDARIGIVQAELFDHVPTGIDPESDDPIVRIGWRRRMCTPLRKVAVRPLPAVVIEQGNHGAHYGVEVIEWGLVVRHFPWRSGEQFVRKARNGAEAYAATDLPEELGAHWRGYGRILDERGEQALVDVFEKFYFAATPETDVTLIYDPCP